jgi:hypothetical protein
VHRHQKEEVEEDEDGEKMAVVVEAVVVVIVVVVVVDVQHLLLTSLARSRHIDAPHNPSDQWIVLCSY